MNGTTTNHVHVSAEEADRGYGRFVNAWNGAGNHEAMGVHLDFEDFATLVAVLTPERLKLLKTLKKGGPVSVRSLSTSSQDGRTSARRAAGSARGHSPARRPGGGATGPSRATRDDPTPALSHSS